MSRGDLWRSRPALSSPPISNRSAQPFCCGLAYRVHRRSLIPLGCLSHNTAPIRPTSRHDRAAKRPRFKHLRKGLQTALASRCGDTLINIVSTMNSGDFKDCASSRTVAILPTRVRFSGDFRGLAGTLQLIPITHISLPDVVSTGITGHYSLTPDRYLH